MRINRSGTGMRKHGNEDEGWNKNENGIEWTR